MYTHSATVKCLKWCLIASSIKCAARKLEIIVTVSSDGAHTRAYVQSVCAVISGLVCSCHSLPGTRACLYIVTAITAPCLRTARADVTRRLMRVCVSVAAPIPHEERRVSGARAGRDGAEHGRQTRQRARRRAQEDGQLRRGLLHVVHSLADGECQQPTTRRSPSCRACSH